MYFNIFVFEQFFDQQTLDLRYILMFNHEKFFDQFDFKIYPDFCISFWNRSGARVKIDFDFGFICNRFLAF